MLLKFKPGHVWHLQIDDHAFWDTARQRFDKIIRSFKHLHVI